ncbi:MAG: class I SAM-dependent methyltransferase [Holophagales bacterium]|nr:class I SAM-dependent methyltransferase [Holophagales bacterium]MYC09765.1 class I SAM-dependent methyltransferase [Holophagales bacterium]
MTVARSRSDRRDWLKRAMPRWLVALFDGFVDLLIMLRLAVKIPSTPVDRLDTPDLVERTDSFNLAAERYFAEHVDRGFQLGKPFSAGEFPRYLFNLGVLSFWGKLAPGDTVADFGAGSCWVSHFLNLWGCRTIAIDVSKTALELGQEMFQRHPGTRWDLEPRFVVYDGHSIPLEDATCDRVIVHDSFHHVPNQELVMGELSRITRDGGIVALREPGRRHSRAEDSRREAETTGVLENDIVVEELGRLARSCGFSKASVVPVTLGGVLEVDTDDFSGFVRGRGWVARLRHSGHALLDAHFILLYKGRFQPTTRSNHGLRAQIELVNGDRLAVAAGSKLDIPIRLRNEGEARWLGQSHGTPGMTCVGAHLKDADDRVVDYDWYRLSLAEDLEPGDERELSLQLTAPAVQGLHVVEIDMVAEGVTWFAQQGSPTTRLTVDVLPAP